MKVLILTGVFFSLCLFAQTSVTTSAPTATVNTSEAVAPSASSSDPILVDPVAAPPKWAENLLVRAQALPFFGPLIAKAIFYAGIVSSILTAIVSCILTILNILMLSFSAMKLEGIALALANFKSGKFMYYLKWFSMFNAKAPMEREAIPLKPVPS